MHSCKQPIPIMSYGNPVQIGDKVSVAAMGTRGDKRGWEVLPPPNTDPNWLLPRPETLFLAQLCSCSPSSDWNVLSSPKIFRKLKWLGGFLIYWYQNICSPFCLKTTTFCPKIHILGHFWANIGLATSFGALLIGWLLVLARGLLYQ